MQLRRPGHCGGGKSSPATANAKTDPGLSDGGGLRRRQSNRARHFQQALYVGIPLHQEVVTGTRKLAMHGSAGGPAQS